jgi:hypothetical protein
MITARRTGTLSSAAPDLVVDFIDPAAAWAKWNASAT